MNCHRLVWLVLAGTFAALMGSSAFAQDALDGAGPYPEPQYACSDGVTRTPPETFSIAYRPFPEPFGMFGAQLSEAAEQHLSELGLRPAPRGQADVVIAIRYMHARIGRGRGHEHIAFMLVGTCPVISANYFSTREQLMDLVDKYVRGEIETESQSLVPHEDH